MLHWWTSGGEAGALQDLQQHGDNLGFEPRMRGVAQGAREKAITDVAGQNGRVAARFALADGGVATLAIPSSQLVAAYSRDDVVLGLRPEAITDGTSADRSAALQFVENRIDLIKPAGSDTFVISRMGGTDVVARLRADARPAARCAVPARNRHGEVRAVRSDDAGADRVVVA